jgi:hypothetical protein
LEEKKIKVLILLFLLILTSCFRGRGGVEAKFAASFIQYSALLSNISTNRLNITADGVDEAEVLVTLIDVNSRPVIGVAPVIVATDSSLSNNYYPCSLTDYRGESRCRFTSTKAELKVVSMVSPLTLYGPQFSFEAGVADAVYSHISGTGPVLANGTEASTITITLKDSFANPVQGIVPAFSATGSSNIYEVCSASNSSGISSCQLKSNAVGVKNLMITSPISDSGSSVVFDLDSPPVTSDFSPSAFNEDTMALITLPYSDADSDPATACSITNLNQVSETQVCTCSGGTCQVGVTGLANYFGNGNFSFRVEANGRTSNVSVASITINPVDDPPVVSSFTASDFNEDVQSIIILNYLDIEGESASACNVTNLTNVNVTQACACSGGVCSVGVTGFGDYSGSGSFNFSVTVNSAQSNIGLVTLNIVAVDDAPVSSDITPASFNEDTQSIINLVYSDSEGDAASSCALTNLTNVTITQNCSCSSGVCTVGVTGIANYFGSAGFDYSVSANGKTSNQSHATLTIAAVDDAPVTVNSNPASFNEDTEGLINLPYSDIEGDQAISCLVTNLINVYVSTACNCAAGNCSVGITGLADYFGPGSFDFTVTTNSLVSNSSKANLTIDPVDDSPVVQDFSAPAFDEDVQSLITLAYTDTEGDQSNSCNVFNLNNVTITQTCACSAGSCQVGVTGLANYYGTGSFDYQVTSNGKISNTALVSLTINAVNDQPVISAIPTQYTVRNVVTDDISFTINDIESELSCSTSSLSMLSSDPSKVKSTSVSWSGTAPNCIAHITPETNQTGAVNISFVVTDGDGGSTSSSFTLNIVTVSLVWTNLSGTVITSYDFGFPNANASVNLRIKNTGDGPSFPLSINFTSGDPNFSVGTTDCTTLAAGASCNVTLNWSNTGLSGIKNGIFTVSSPGSSATLNVSGTKL